MQVSEAQARQTSEERSVTNGRADTVLLLAIAMSIAVLHLLTNNRYGFHRDELQFLSDARHLDWGFVSYPPFTAAIERIAMSLFGLSMVGLRLFSVLAQFTAIFVSGLIARELGGRRMAQVAAALTTAFSPVSLFEGTLFQYTSFDLLWWILTAYLVLRLLNSEDPRWWVGIGAIIGIGLETKYSIIFLIGGILVGIICTPARSYAKSRWFWAGIATSLLIFLPNFVWLLRHDLITYHFLQNIHARDVAQGRAASFLRDQFFLCANPAAIPLWLAGFAGLLLNRRYRMLAYIAAVPVAVLWISKGRGYYTAGAYPPLVAMGAVIAERWLVWLPPLRRRTLAAAWSIVFVVSAGFMCAVVIPIAPSGPLREFALARNGDMREEFGWTELTRKIADIRDTLSPEQRAGLGILTGNYGEEGAIEIYGPAYQLPEPMGTTNSAWTRGFPTPEPTTIIVVGFSRAGAELNFSGCRVAGRNGNSEGIKNEESEFHPDIFVCGPPRKGWPQFWREHQSFG
jgi:Dolichyl-phosphate-mannose-protein mannosyltransferase